MDEYEYIYGYTDSDWEDLLTSYRGQTISYDAAGNPLSYYNGQSYTFTWENGRQLARAVVGGQTLTYKYNVDGIRTEKTLLGEYTDTYRLNGTQVVEMSRDGSDGAYRLVFVYDENGSPLCFDLYSGSNTTSVRYYYVTNLQGDVVRLINSNNATVADYTYDAWGKLLSVTDANGNAITSEYHIANINPLRYRGYFYDIETGLYYVSSRYYDPEIGRWINADSVVAGVGGNIKGYNLFAYCFNNPVNMSDQTGLWPKWMKDTVKWVAKNVVKPVVKNVQNTLSKVDLTYSTGVNLSGTPSAWIFNGQIGVSMDTKGNVAIQASSGGGVTGGTPSISISGYRSITNAPSINELNGMGYQIGGSAIIPVEGVPVAVGGDFNIIPDLERNRTYYGGALIGGLAAGSPGGEIHIEWGTTVTLPKTQFNIYDVARSVYTKIMEW